ncbi:MAG TPA: glycosyltransferase family 2 protein [Parafilimonas sp.]|jgi:glycosyltransferase involved in cell wall biosynthesis
MHKHNKLVSIIMATYNGEKFLHEQLISVVQQTYPYLEIIIVDDNSTDNTPNILRAFARQHSNIHLYFNEHNLGYIKTFEKGCTLASGNYISFCDQDDVWALNKIELQMQTLRDDAMVYCNDEMVDTNLNSLSKQYSDFKQLSSFDNCLHFATDNCVAGHSMIMKKELFNFAYPFPKEIPHDHWCAFCATFFGGVKYLNKPLVKWRMHENNVTHSEVNKKETIRAMRKRLDIFFNTCPPEYKKEKTILKKLSESYKSFSLQNNFLRMNLFIWYKNYLLATKKRNTFRKFFFCLKMFYKLR